MGSRRETKVLDIYHFKNIVIFFLVTSTITYTVYFGEGEESIHQMIMTRLQRKSSLKLELNHSWNGSGSFP